MSIQSEITTLQTAAMCTFTSPKLGDPCMNCRKRPSTKNWIGEGGLLVETHGFYRYWCDVCVLTAQLEYAERIAANIPALKAELEKTAG